MPSCSYLKIDLDAIEHNLNQFLDKKSVMAMVKADAYGIGAVELIPYLEKFGVSILGVSHANEGVFLRQSGIKMPIFVISAPPFDAQKIARYHLQCAVSSIEEITALNHAAQAIIPVHLYINTGMNRFGAPVEKTLDLVKTIQQAPNLHLEGVMTHFASADLPSMDAYTQKQISSFKEAIDLITPTPRWIHAENGPASLRFSLPFCNLARVGAALFGYSTSYPLRSALTLQSHLAHINHPQRGETIGYHCDYQVIKEKMRVGIIPFGYHDGLHRHYKEMGYTLIHGKQAALVGNICMDFMMVDLTDIPEAQVGDPVILFNSTLRPETVASLGNTDVRELLSCIGKRTKRILISNYEQKLRQPIRPIEESPPPREHFLTT